VLGRRIAVGAVESLLTSACLRKRVGDRRRQRACGGTIIAYLAGLARWDIGLVSYGPRRLGVG
jgi:hypothetical protein